MEINRSVDAIKNYSHRNSNQNPKASSKTPDVHQVITGRIIALLESGRIPWRVPWKTSSHLPQNLITKRPYRRFNLFLLHSLGYSSRLWLMFSQAQSLGGKIWRGEKAYPVVFWKWLRIEKDAEKKWIPELQSLCITAHNGVIMLSTRSRSTKRKVYRVSVSLSESAVKRASRAGVLTLPAGGGQQA